MDMNAMIEYSQSLTVLGSIGGLAIALLGAGLAAALSGIGSASCGPDMYERYRMNDRKVRFAFSIVSK